MTRVFLTPVDLASATRTGNRTFRKQVLPLGSITYQGRKITFDRKYLTELSNAFRRRAYDQVPLIHADPENRHNMDPKRYAGEILDLTVEKDGLYATVKPGKKAAKILEENPKMGVSARIVEGLTKADGRSYSRAIQHILLTMDPRVTGMRPWQTVNLSQADPSHQIVDLTGCTFDKEKAMPKKKITQPASGGRAKIVGNKLQIDLADLTDDELEILLADDEPDPTAPDHDPNVTPSIPPDANPDTTTDEPEGDEDDEDAEDEDDEDLSDIDFGDQPTQTAASASPAKPGGGNGNGSGGGTKNLSKKGSKKKRIDLASAGPASRRELSEVRTELAKARWEKEKGDYARAGVPPFLLDLATPVLSSPESTVLDLSGADEPVDAGATIRQMLDGVKGMIDLTPELGHSFLPDPDDETKTMLEAWEKEYGVR